MSDERRHLNLHDATVFWGTLVGFFVGAIVWLLRVPKRGEETREEIVETGRTLIEHDPVKESLEEGKALAHRYHQRELEP
ncbi:MAG: hypothetical protein ACFE0Q_17490 [Anaerolineae bacterium]